MTKNIKQSIDNIRPSLTSEQNELLTSEQQNFNKELGDLMNSAKIIQEQLGEQCELVKEYKNSIDKVSSILHHCKYNEELIQNVVGLYFNVEKITLVQNDLLVSDTNYCLFFFIVIDNVCFQRQQSELDLLLNKSKQVADKVAVHDDILSESNSLVKQWSELERAMSSRITLVTEVGDKWKNVEDAFRKIEIDLTRIKDALTNIDQVIRSKNQLVESLVTLRVSIISLLIHILM